MDIDIIGKLNDWTSFAYKNLFGLFSRKAEIMEKNFHCPASIVFTCKNVTETSHTL